MSRLNTGFDNDLDSFLDLDQSTYTPSSASPATGKQPLHRPPFANTSSSFGGQSQHTFSGPSFQYDAYKQQTGLPVGGLANTFAVNQAMGLQYTGSHQGFVMPTETLNIPLSNLDDFDFASNPSVDMQDVDFDADSPSEMFKGQFVNPNALLGQDDSPTYTTPIRMYPGIHQQQAQAKAQQVQKQQEMAARQQQQRQLEGQRPLPSQSKPTGQKDPHVEESISRLLSQMRHNSVVSNDDSVDTPTGSQPSLAARLKKEEDEMDEDERLLASEEGKKLSSKERRQLRNKVSARAFRSRRKGKNSVMISFTINADNVSQNTSVSSKAKSLKRHRKPTSSVSRTVNFWRRTLVSPT
jgi:bZIP-type transcription factor MBZ1